MTKINIKFYFLFGLVFIIAILTPHLVHGHVFIPVKYAQSAVLFLDLIMAYIFYLVYKREIDKINHDKRRIKEDLLDSYKYIGKVNRQVDLFKKFINFLSLNKDKNKFKGKNIFDDLLTTMMNSVAKSDKGLIRFINKDSGRTIKEFFYHKEGDQFVVKLSNAKLIKEDLDFNELVNDNGEINIVSSDYDYLKIRCILCYTKKEEGNTDIELLKTLLNQIHLLFLIIYSRVVVK